MKIYAEGPKNPQSGGSNGGPRPWPSPKPKPN